MNTKQLIENWPAFDAETKAILLQAISTRGKHKGFILASAPSERKRPEAWLAWQVLISNLAPVRASVWGLMFSNKVDLFKQLDNIVGARDFVFALNAIEPAARWNLWCMNHDVDFAKTAVAKILDRQDIS